MTIAHYGFGCLTARGFISMMRRVDDQKRKNEEMWQESIQNMDEADVE